jgi:protein-S-isoprenylcysteine O-methyltransferase Ste14
MAIGVLAGAVVLWGALHSWLASLRAKAAAQRTLGATGSRWYRLAYNAFAAVSFVPVLVLLKALPDQGLYAVRPPWLYLMLAGEGAAAILLLFGLLQTDPIDFIGLREKHGNDPSARLITTGFYRWVRHPLYLFGLLLLWLTPVMTVNLLTVFLLLTAYIFIGAAFEERRLVQEFGSAYTEYRRRTPMIFPVPLFKPRNGSDTGVSPKQ